MYLETTILFFSEIELVGLVRLLRKINIKRAKAANN